MTDTNGNRKFVITYFGVVDVVSYIEVEAESVEEARKLAIDNCPDFASEWDFASSVENISWEVSSKIS